MKRLDVEAMAQTAIEEIENGEDESTAVGNAIGAFVDEFEDDYMPTLIAVAEIVNNR